MKSRFTLLIFFTLYMSSFAADPVDIKSILSGVTVYLNGARISRVADVTVPKGNTAFRFSDLPANLDDQSIQVKGEGNFVILSIVHETNYLSRQRKSSMHKMLEDSLKIYEDQLAWISSYKDILNSEENMLYANQVIGSKDKGLVLNDLKLAVDYYRTRLSEIKKEEIKLSRQAIETTEKKERIKNQLDVLNVKLSEPTSDVLVNVSADKPVTGNLQISYTVYEAGWVPAYDVRAKDIQNPVHLFYNAKVYQNTGEDWNKVLLKLSTADPRQSGVKPDLQPWFLDFMQPVIYSRQYNTVTLHTSMDAEVAAAPMEVKKSEATLAAGYVSVNENQTNLEFAIKIPYDVPSDNKQYTINIQDLTLPATYEYYCAPKLDRDAFLLARITGWEDYNLLSGEMNLFFEDTYVGKSQLDVRNTKDTLDLSLGRDKSIVVTRVKMKDFTSEKVIGSNKKETRAWEITIRNNKKQSVDLKIEDQLPVSMNKDIEISGLDYSGGALNKETGLITWRQKIEPSVEKKLRVSFEVKYPKDRVVYLE
ncbi:MAG TPA: DUF4139 domain-containing protein [Bacteroidales bacterium]|nr:DUF4139 domain-containing protein [Bacteroidales bacterium]